MIRRSNIYLPASQFRVLKAPIRTTVRGEKIHELPAQGDRQVWTKVTRGKMPVLRQHRGLAEPKTYQRRAVQQEVAFEVRYEEEAPVKREGPFLNQWHAGKDDGLIWRAM